jgi:hypothetical protein
MASCFYGGGFSDGSPFVGKRVATECLDLAVTQTEDRLATGPVVAYQFGNRCYHEIHVDLSSVHAVGRYKDGTRPLKAYDPRHELRSMQLDGWSTGREEIEYLADDAGPPTAICVDVGRIDRSASPTARWLCFGSWDLGKGGEIGYGASDAPPLEVTPASATGWPLPAGAEPEVTAMPARAQLSIQAAGGYLAARISNKLRLVKALHDFVVLRLDYDDAAKTAIDRKDWDRVPSQEAEDVFARRKGVCSGYSRLLVALGKAAGVEIRYVTGYARDDGHETAADLTNHAHAWNAARIDDQWVLIDATWDDTSDGKPATQFLFMPPALFGTSHLPDDRQWMLVAPIETLDEFVRQPWLGGRHR